MVRPLGVGILGRVTKKLFRTLDLSGIDPSTTTAGPLVYAGSSSSTISSSTANTKFMQYYLESSATSGDNRAKYLRLYLSGAGGGGEAFRGFTTVSAACTTAHGSHISLNFAGDTTGSLSGLGVAVRGTLHIPDDASWTSGTLAALQAEIYSDGDHSDTDGCTEVSFIRIINDGNANGKADVDDDAFLMSLQGFTVGAGNVVAAKTSSAVSHGARIKIGSDTYYIMLSDTQ